LALAALALVLSGAYDSYPVFYRMSKNVLDIFLHNDSGYRNLFFYSYVTGPPARPNITDVSANT